MSVYAVNVYMVSSELTSNKEFYTFGLEIIALSVPVNKVAFELFCFNYLSQSYYKYMFKNSKMSR